MTYWYIQQAIFHEIKLNKYRTTKVKNRQKVHRPPFLIIL